MHNWESSGKIRKKPCPGHHPCRLRLLPRRRLSPAAPAESPAPAALPAQPVQAQRLHRPPGQVSPRPSQQRHRLKSPRPSHGLRPSHGQHQRRSAPSTAPVRRGTTFLLHSKQLQRRSSPDCRQRGRPCRSSAGVRGWMGHCPGLCRSGQCQKASPSSTLSV